MKKINFNENRNLSGILNDSIQFIKLEGKTLFRFYFRFLLPLLVPLAFFTYQADLLEITKIINIDPTQLESLLGQIDLPKIWLVILNQALIWLVFLSVTLIYIRNYCDPKSKELSHQEMWSQMLYEFPKIFIIQFFYLGMLFFGLVSFIIPGIYFGVSFALATVILVFKDTRIFEAMSLSLRLVIKKWFKVFGFLFLLYLISFVVRILFQLPFSMIADGIEKSGELSKISFTILNSFQTLINLFASLFPVIGSVFIYYILEYHTEPIAKKEEKSSL